MKNPFIAILILLCAALFADIDVRAGRVRLVISDYDGAVSIYRQKPGAMSGAKVAYVSLLDSSPYTTRSAFYALLDKNVYKLGRGNGIKIKTENIGNGGLVTFTLQKKVVISLTFTLFSSVLGEAEDSIRVDIQCSNQDELIHVVGVKAVFDTWLGESSNHHFSSANQKELNTEYYFTDMTNNHWVQSANDDFFIRFVFSDARISPQTIALANKDVLAAPVWAPALIIGRTFDSLYSYNNSAVSAAWRPALIDAGSFTDTSFEILTGDKNSGLGKNLLQVADGTYPTILEWDRFSDKNPDELAYIRSLIKRVRELEAEPDHIDRDEIMRLNAEIDKILEKIGR